MKLNKAAFYGAIGAMAAELFRRIIEQDRVMKNKNMRFYSCPKSNCVFYTASTDEAVVKRDRIEHEGWHQRVDH